MQTNRAEANIQRSTFDLSHGHKTVMDAGWLVPIYVDEALPGDTFNVSASLFARLITPLTPFMDNVEIDVHYFAIPNRLVWDNWQKFMGESDEPGIGTDFLIPTATPVSTPSGAPTGNEAAAASLYNYLGVPGYMGAPGAAITVNNLFARAYNLVYNEFYRDQNLSDKAIVDKDDGPDTWTDYYIRYRSKKHDYFTSCLPWPQKGPGVEIPISGIPVVGTVSPPAYPNFSSGGTGQTELKYGASGANAAIQAVTAPGTGNLMWKDPRLMIGTAAVDEPAGTINALRQAFQIQRLLERDARGGTRYIELLKSHFGVTSPDYRLQRPEYLGGGTVKVNVNPIPQTSATGAYATTPQGTLTATATASGTKARFNKSFVEHSIILGIASIRADLTYQTGLHKMFSRRTKYDFYWPALAMLGEQAVLNSEIYHQGDGVTANDDVFGYQERWAEYRTKFSRTSSIMQSKHPVTLDVWHLGEDFANLPVLGDQFITTPPPIDRVIAVGTQPQFLLDTWFSVRAARPLPTYSIPGMADHL